MTDLDGLAAGVSVIVPVFQSTVTLPVLVDRVDAALRDAGPYEVILVDDGSGPDTMRVEYMDGIRVVAREWVCFDHAGFARRKAEAWWGQRSKWPAPPDVKSAVEYAATGGLREPAGLVLSTVGKFPEIVGWNWNKQLETA